MSLRPSKSVKLSEVVRRASVVVSHLSDPLWMELTLLTAEAHGL